MTPTPCCPVCRADRLSEIGRRVWSRSEIDAAPEYLRHRLRVLFELWCDRDRFEATWRLCERCGLVTYWPRPTAEQIDAKYRRLVDVADDPTPPVDSEYNRRRVATLTKLLTPYLAADAGVLDFGGGDGRLLARFAARGHRCAVVDYVPETIPGVDRLGDTLDDVPPGTEPFDAAVCSHVLEHVADPVGMLRRLRTHLRPGATVYVELPMEVWKGPPRVREPVTHVNYFTAAPTRRLLIEAGLRPLRVCTEGLSLPRPGGGWTHAVVLRAIGRVEADDSWLHAARSQADADPRAARSVRRMLSPGVSTRLWYASRTPRQSLRALLAKLPKPIRPSDDR